MRTSKRGRDRTLSNDTLETERRAAPESPADHLRRTISTATHASKKSESSPSLSSLSWKLCVMITKDEAEHTKQTTHSWYCQITLPTTRRALAGAGQMGAKERVANPCPQLTVKSQLEHKASTGVSSCI
eukprot:CAMPEP_0169279442 /NCGR_PEP_ID=MMETSP1016-20121227/54987_1 /TAXON_ID=342587 /ORGANISM="Karlodinium micrum, Strain CCMP2283" /LENGTH=128 /DNA_ID=CAMNT_0009367523 /DNA_START=774 /DNA_END=1160 /DNA_ORIENTATION=+